MFTNNAYPKSQRLSFLDQVQSTKWQQIESSRILWSLAGLKLATPSPTSMLPKQSSFINIKSLPHEPQPAIPHTPVTATTEIQLPSPTTPCPVNTICHSFHNFKLSPSQKLAAEDNTGAFWTDSPLKNGSTRAHTLNMPSQPESHRKLRSKVGLKSKAASKAERTTGSKILARHAFVANMALSKTTTTTAKADLSIPIPDLCAHAYTSNGPVAQVRAVSYVDLSHLPEDLFPAGRGLCLALPPPARIVERGVKRKRGPGTDEVWRKRAREEYCGNEEECAWIEEGESEEEEDEEDPECLWGR